MTCSGHAGHAGEPPASRYEASAPTPKATADTTSSEVYLSDSQRVRENSTSRKARRRLSARRLSVIESAKCAIDVDETALV